METERKIAIFMSEVEFEDFQNRNQIIKGLVEKVEELKSSKEDRKVEICFWAKNENKNPVIFFEENTIMFNSIGDSDLAEKVALKLQKEESLLRSLVTEIQNLNSQKEILRAKFNRQPRWIKWFMK